MNFYKVTNNKVTHNYWWQIVLIDEGCVHVWNGGGGGVPPAPPPPRVSATSIFANKILKQCYRPRLVPAEQYQQKAF